MLFDGQSKIKMDVPAIKNNAVLSWGLHCISHRPYGFLQSVTGHVKALGVVLPLSV